MCLVLVGGVLDACPEIQFHVLLRQAIVLEAEFIFRFSRGIVHQFRLTLVVPAILLDFVLQRAPAEHEKMIPTLPVILVRGTQRVTPLHAFRQIIEQVFLVIVGIFHVFIQIIHVVSPDTQNRQFAFGGKIRCRLELYVIVHREKRQPDHVEQELEITPSRGHDKGRFRGERTVERYPEIGSPQSSPYFYFIRIPGYLFEVEQRTHQVSPVCRKSTGIKVHLFHEINIHDTDHATGSPLRGEVVQVR